MTFSDHELIRDLLSSGMAGLIARFVCHPLDTCKARLQSAAHFSGTIDVISKTYSAEGLKGFYRGIGASMIGGLPGVCIYMTSYNQSKEYLNKFDFARRYPFLTYFTSGMVAEAFR